MSFFEGAAGKPQQLDTFRFNRAVYGTVIPELFGTMRLPVSWIWAGDFDTHQNNSKFSIGGSGGKSGAQSAQYSMSFQGALCLGPTSQFTNLLGRGWVSGQYSGRVTAAQNNGPGGWYYATGTAVQPVWPWLTALHPEAAIAYSRLAFVAAANFDLGNSSTPPQLEFEIYGSGAQTNNNNAAAQGDAFPTYIMVTLITDPVLGLGIGTTSGGNPVATPGAYSNIIGLERPYTVPPNILAGAFQEFTVACLAQNLWLSALLDSQRPASDILKDLLDITNSEMIFADEQFFVVPYVDQTVSGPTTYLLIPNPTYTPIAPRRNFGDADFKTDGKQPPVSVERIQPQDRYNVVRATVVARGDDYRINHIDSHEQTLVDLYGERAAPSLNWQKYIARPDVGIRSITFKKLKLAYQLGTYKFRVGGEHIDLDPMDQVTITDPTQGLNLFPVWIQQMEEQEDGSLELTCIDVFPATSVLYGLQPMLGGSGSDSGAQSGSAN